MTLTIAVLSWGAHKTLINTLESYKTFGLDRLGDERLIFFQEISEEDKKIAQHYGYEPIGSTENIGIAGGYKTLVERTTSELFLFLENDWSLLQFPDRAIAQGMYMLENGLIDIVRYRSRFHPGWPLWTLQFRDNEYERPTHLLDCVHWKEDPTDLPEISEGEFSGWWKATSAYANWTNNPHMACTDFIRDTILPQVSDGDIEMKLQPWWEKQTFWVAQGDGLFTHNRIG